MHTQVTRCFGHQKHKSVHVCSEPKQQKRIPRCCLILADDTSPWLPVMCIFLFLPCEEITSSEWLTTTTMTTSFGEGKQIEKTQQGSHPLTSPRNKKARTHPSFLPKGPLRFNLSNGFFMVS